MLLGLRRTPRTTLRGSLRALPALALGGTLAACVADPVVWDDAAERHLPAPAATGVMVPDQAADAAADSTVYAALHPAPHTGARTDDIRQVTTPEVDDPQACPHSVRTGWARDQLVAAVWWSARRDGSAALLASRSADDGRTWSRPTPVDTVDRSEAACNRPAPSVAVDSANGYLHVAYSMEAPEGKGIFYAHQMDPRAPFERPQVVVYGDRPAATSVASAGDLVVVAYEDPNTGGRPFVSLALSHTAGHSFAERFAASEGSMSAEHPVVAVAARAAGGPGAGAPGAGATGAGAPRVALGWVERTAPRVITGTDDPRSVTNALPSGVVVRVGQLREQRR